MITYPAYGPMTDRSYRCLDAGPKCKKAFRRNQAVSNNSEEMQHVE